MPKGAPFAEGLSILEYQRLVKDRPYVSTLVNAGGNVEYTYMRQRLKQVTVPLTPAEQYFLNRVNLHLRKQLYIAVTKYNAHGPRWVKVAPSNSKANIKALLKGVPIPPIERGISVTPGLLASFNQKAVNPAAYLGDDDSITKETRILVHRNAPTGQYQLDLGCRDNGYIVLNQKGVDNLVRMARDSRTILDELNAGIAAIDSYQVEQARKAAAEAQAKIQQLRQEAQAASAKAQAAAAKASYEESLAFKTEEFNRALAAQKAESETTRRQLLDNFEKQSGNIRTDLTRAHQAELAQREEEHVRRSKDYEARLAQFSENFERQAKELSGVRLEIAKQKEDYESQISARKLEESKREQEAEVLQSNLKRRIAIYEAGRGANLHFVGVNGKDGQGKGARVFANSGGRYVRSRVSYGPNGGFRYLNSGSENSNVPDLFLDVLSPSNKKKERK